MDADGYDAGLRGRLFTALTGRAGDVSGQRGGDVRNRLIAAFGTTARGGLNTRAAAAGLGVSQRTVQRWVAPQGRQRSTPSRSHDQAITRTARRAATTRAGRRAALAPTRASSMTRYGTKVTLRGNQGVVSGGRDYARFRAITLTLEADDATAMLDAYEAGGDRGLVEFLEGVADRDYAAEWQFGTINELDFT